MSDFLSRLARRAAGQEPTGSTLEPRTRPMYAAEAVPADLQPFVPPPASQPLDGDNDTSSKQPPRSGARPTDETSRSDRDRQPRSRSRGESQSEQHARVASPTRQTSFDKAPPRNEPSTYDLPAYESPTSGSPPTEPPAQRGPRSANAPTRRPAETADANVADELGTRSTLSPRSNLGDARREQASVTRDASPTASPESVPETRPKRETAEPTRPSFSNDATHERQSRPSLRPRRSEPSPTAPEETPAEASKPAEVTIEIGRLEVRAASTKKTQAPAPSRQKFRPNTSLDDYLARRRGDDR